MADDLFPGLMPQPMDLSEAMKRQQLLGLLGQMSGDKAIAPAGESLFQNAQAQQRMQMEMAHNQQIAQHRLALEQLAQRRLEKPPAPPAQPSPTQQAMADVALVRQGLEPQFGAKPNPNAPALGAPLRQRAGAGGKAPAVPTLLSPEALAVAVAQAKRTGKIPNYGMGASGAAIKVQIMEGLAKNDPSVDLAGNAAGYLADTHSLNKQQQLYDLTKSWEGTGRANLGVLRDVSRQLANSGVPLLNGPLRTIFQKAAGDPTVTKFKAAHAAVVNEYAKILSGSTGSAGVTDAARREAEEMLPLDSTPAQIAAAADLLETDAGNRLSSLEKQLAETKARTSGTAAVPAGAATDKEAARAAARKKYGI